MSRVERRWENDGFFRSEAACGLNGWGKDRVDPVVAEIWLPPHVVSNNDEFYWPFGRLELHGRVFRLFVSGHKAHMSRGNANKSGHVVVASNCLRCPR